MDFRDKVSGFPNAPGIYRFLSRGSIVYIGKSKRLRSRVSSYFHGRDGRSKILVMMQNIDDVEIIECDTHLEARMLEYRQIQEYKPIYNSQYISDRKAHYFDITGDQRILELKTKGEIGPFLGHRIWRDFAEDLSRIFPINYENGTFDFEYHVLPKRMDAAEIEATTEAIRGILTSRLMGEMLKSVCHKLMMEASFELRFERASYFKGLIRYLDLLERNLFDKQDFLKNRYVLKDGEYLFYIANGKVLAKGKDVEVQDFIKRCRDLKEDDVEFSDELVQIVYSELSSPDVELFDSKFFDGLASG